MLVSPYKVCVVATNWMLSRRKYALTAEADAVVDLFINGVGRK